MIKLYAISGACSLAPHIVLEELKLPYELKLFHWSDKAMLEELKKINPMRQVPTLVTEEGYTLAEGAAIMQYLVSRKPNNLFPEEGLPRFKAFEWMNFISTALHKGFVPLFKPAIFSDDESHFETIKRVAQKRLETLFKITEEKIAGPYALGENFTVADAYLFTVLHWSKHFQLDLSPYKKISAFMELTAKRPAVVSAMKGEGF